MENEINQQLVSGGVTGAKTAHGGFEGFSPSQVMNSTINVNLLKKIFLPECDVNCIMGLKPFK